MSNDNHDNAALARIGSGVMVRLFLDEMEAAMQETDFWRSLDDRTGPFRLEGHPHRGEGGSTTACFQRGEMVGLTTAFRDDHNRTVLVCVDLREPNAEVGHDQNGERKPTT